MYICCFPPEPCLVNSVDVWVTVSHFWSIPSKIAPISEQSWRSAGHPPPESCLKALNDLLRSGDFAYNRIVTIG